MSDKQYIQSLIAQGEHEQQDFKFQINDARKIARSISAFANNTGGRLLVGVKDNGSIAGVNSEEEIYMIDQAAQMYCKPEQKPHFSVYYIEGKTVDKVDIDEASATPVKAPDESGPWKAYYRVADENILASSMHVKLLRSKQQAGSGGTITYCEREQMLLDYLNGHGGITLSGFMRLTHCSRALAEQSVVNLCQMGVVTLKYHDGQCVVTLS